jgi:hypothetical protein
MPGIDLSGPLHVEESLRILAIGVEESKASTDEFQPLLAEEARKVWEIYQEEVIREMYFRTDQTDSK